MEGVEGGEGGAAAPEDAPPPPDAVVALQMALADFLVGSLFQSTAEQIIGAWC